jgi:hypothetical protein
MTPRSARWMRWRIRENGAAISIVKSGMRNIIGMTQPVDERADDSVVNFVSRRPSSAASVKVRQTISTSGLWQAFLPTGVQWRMRSDCFVLEEPHDVSAAASSSTGSHGFFSSVAPEAPLRNFPEPIVVSS